MNLTTDEMIALIDCINNRLSDLEDFHAMCPGDGSHDEVSDDMKSLKQLAAKLDKEVDIRVKLKAGAL